MTGPFYWESSNQRQISGTMRVVTCAVCPESAWLVTFLFVSFQEEWSHGVHCEEVRAANQTKMLPQTRCQKRCG